MISAWRRETRSAPILSTLRSISAPSPGRRLRPIIALSPIMENRSGSFLQISVTAGLGKAAGAIPLRCPAAAFPAPGRDTKAGPAGRAGCVRTGAAAFGTFALPAERGAAGEGTALSLPLRSAVFAVGETAEAAAADGRAAGAATGVGIFAGRGGAAGGTLLTGAGFNTWVRMVDSAGSGLGADI